jgi:hypothetical protein
VEINYSSLKVPPVNSRKSQRKRKSWFLGADESLKKRAKLKKSIIKTRMYKSAVKACLQKNDRLADFFVIAGESGVGGGLM